MKQVFLIAGERSGDAHGAALMRSLRRHEPKIEFSGLGGAEMAALAGGSIEDWVEEAGVVGLWEVLKKYGYFRQKFDETVAAIAARQPDAVVFIDYPGFNLRMAKALKNAGNTAKRIYFISPQVWAWNRGRIPKMATFLDRMLCIFPFEKALYEESGLPTEFVGHPLVDEFRNGEAVAEREPDLIGLFPGSRQREVNALFPVYLEAARRLKEAGLTARFIASAASETIALRMEELRSEMDVSAEEVAIETGSSRALMQRATVAAVASGTATLEAAFCELPYCLVYKVAWPTYVVGKWVVAVDHLGIVNVLAGDEVVKELVQKEATPEAVAGELSRLFNDGGSRSRVVARLKEVTASLGDGGCQEKAAEAVLRSIGGEQE